MIGYTKAWMMYVVLSALAIPLCLLVRVPTRSG